MKGKMDDEEKREKKTNFNFPTVAGSAVSPPSKKIRTLKGGKKVETVSELSMHGSSNSCETILRKRMINIGN